MRGRTGACGPEEGAVIPEPFNRVNGATGTRNPPFVQSHERPNGSARSLTVPPYEVTLSEHINES
jgi:hypothetical protein